MELVTLGFTTLVAAFLGSYLGGYLKKKGENLATHEDIGKLVEQMAATTTATKSIEARISNEVWDRQRQWEMKKEAVISAMHALLKADDALVAYKVVYEGDWTAKNPDEYRETKRAATNEWQDRIDEFDQKRAMALLVCDKKTNDAFISLGKLLRSGASMIAKGEKTYSDLAPELSPAFARAFACARHELGTSYSSTKND